MKIISVLLLCLSSFLFKDNDSLKNGLVFKVSIRGSYDLPQADFVIIDSLRYYLLDAKLTNHSTTEKKFVSYLFTVVPNIVTDTKYVKTCLNNFGTNYATTFTLKPGQELNMPIIVQVNNQNLGIQVKFGWIYMDYDSAERNFEKFFENSRKTHENVIWSDPIRMNITGDKPYEIR